MPLADLDMGAMLEYEVYFPGSFDFVMGGKLPGMHGGNLQCSGYSSVPNGNNCFSTRLMWRENGEVRMTCRAKPAGQTGAFVT
jgi:hypothetical protein